MSGSIFDMDNPFWRWIGRLPELIALSFFWFLGCIPIITILPSCCALFDAVSRNTMLDEKGSFRRFFRSFVRELRQGIPLTIFWLVIFGLLLFSAWVVSKEQSLGIFSVVYGVSFILMLGYLGWLVPLQSRYTNSFVGLHINAFRFFVGRLPATGLMLLISAAVITVCLIHPSTLWLSLFAPALIAVLHSRIVEKAFMLAFPDHYEDGLPVYTEQNRDAIKAIKKAKQDEKNANDE